MQRIYEDEKVGLGSATWVFLITVIVLGVALIGGIIAHNHDYYVTTTHEIWSVTAPFGVYYTDIDGSFIFGSGGVSSSLSEAYVVKYLSDGELKTISLDSTSEHVHLLFVNDTNTLYIMEFMRDGFFGDVHRETLDQYYIQIPEPVI